MNISDLKSALVGLVRNWDREDENSFSLWTYLPSYASAEKHFGDYASEKQPFLSDLMEESRLLVVLLFGGKLLKSSFIYWFYCSLEYVENTVDDEDIYEFLREWFQEKGFILQEDGAGIEIKVSLARMETDGSLDS